MNTQFSLFSDQEEEQVEEKFFAPEIPSSIGRTQISLSETSKILSRAQGFMGDYDFTLNPYSGCGFGCAYCYAAFFVNDRDKRQNWGMWVDVKTNAVNEIKKSRSLYDKKIYMSSVTDPYQPLESKVGLTRGILEEMVSPLKMPRLVVQTRSPLVTRDIDLLSRFDFLRVNMTVTTDSDEVRKNFEPYCPSNEQRLEAIAEVKAAGIKICICITPMLPLEDPERFARRLAAMNADIYVAQPFKPSNGPFAASTRSMAVEIAKQYNWSEREYSNAFAMMRKYLPGLYEGREGFMPE